MTSSSTTPARMVNRRCSAGSGPGKVVPLPPACPRFQPPALLVHPVAAPHFCSSPHHVLPAGQAWPQFATKISHQCANLQPWHKMGQEIEDGAGTASKVVTIQDEICCWAACAGSSAGSMPNPRFRLERTKVCLLCRSEDLLLFCF